jgi:hypothetical protein
MTQCESYSLGDGAEPTNALRGCRNGDRRYWCESRYIACRAIKLAEVLCTSAAVLYVRPGTTHLVVACNASRERE